MYIKRIFGYTSRFWLSTMPANITIQRIFNNYKDLNPKALQQFLKKSLQIWSPTDVLLLKQKYINNTPVPSRQYKILQAFVIQYYQTKHPQVLKYLHEENAEEIQKSLRLLINVPKINQQFIQKLSIEQFEQNPRILVILAILKKKANFDIIKIEQIIKATIESKPEYRPVMIMQFFGNKNPEQIFTTPIILNFFDLLIETVTDFNQDEHAKILRTLHVTKDQNIKDKFILYIKRLQQLSIKNPQYRELSYRLMKIFYRINLKCDLIIDNMINNPLFYDWIFSEAKDTIMVDNLLKRHKTSMPDVLMKINCHSLIRNFNNANMQRSKQQDQLYLIEQNISSIIKFKQNFTQKQLQQIKQHLPKFINYNIIDKSNVSVYNKLYFLCILLKLQDLQYKLLDLIEENIDQKNYNHILEILYINVQHRRQCKIKLSTNLQRINIKELKQLDLIRFFKIVNNMRQQQLKEKILRIHLKCIYQLMLQRIFSIITLVKLYGQLAKCRLLNIQLMLQFEKQILEKLEHNAFIEPKDLMTLIKEISRYVKGRDQFIDQIQRHIERILK